MMLSQQFRREVLNFFISSFLVSIPPSIDSLLIISKLTSSLTVSFTFVEVCQMSLFTIRKWNNISHRTQIPLHHVASDHLYLTYRICMYAYRSIVPRAEAAEFESG